MGYQEAKLELRLIAEKLRNRFTVPGRLEGTQWSPKVMDIPPGQRFLVLSPHPDDDTVGCGGTIVKLLEAGKDVRVVYLSMQVGEFTPDERRREIHSALEHLGVRDFSLRESSFPSLKEAIEIITQEIRSYVPDAVFAPSPFENHDQHLRTFEAFRLAVEKMSVNPDAILYEIWNPLMPNLLIPVNEAMERKVTAIRDHWTQVREIDYVRVSQGLTGYRAASLALEGYAEAFLHLPAKDVVRLFHG